MTIKDVAEYSGVSVSTVSRVLNHHPAVSDAVRARVMEAVEKLHYVPNNSARDLVRPQSDAIGLVVRGVGNPNFTGVIPAIENAIGQAGYTMVLHQIRSGEDEIQAGASLARSKRLRGLILLGGCFDYTPEQTAALDIPFVCCSFTNSFGSLDRSAYSSVSIDDQEEARRAVELLIRNGHRKIAVLLDSVCDHSISELRYKGYRAALRDSGIPFDADLLVETDGCFEMPETYAGASRLIKSGADFTAVFTLSDTTAMAAMKALEDHGRRVPEDCSVIAIDGINVSEYVNPTLTTMVQPVEEMGRESVHILADMIEQRCSSRHLRLEARLRQGGSVRQI